MLKIFNFSPKYPKEPITPNFYFLITIILFLSNLNQIICQLPQYDCNFFSSLTQTQCFNNIFKFDHKNYQSNNFARNKNGDLVLEFSEDNEISSSRLFYGLTKDGRYFFKNQSSYTYELNIDNYDLIEDFNYYGIYNSINLFVSIKNDPNKVNQYLFSLNSYYSTVELYNFNKDNNNTHYIWNLYNFFNLDEDDYIFPYELSLFELPKENTYIISIIPKVIVYEDILNITFIQKFRLKSFDNEAYEELDSINYEDYFKKKIITTLLMDDHKTLVILTYEKNNKPVPIYNPSKPVYRRRLERKLLSSSSPYWIIFKFYNHNLKLLNYANDIELVNFPNGYIPQGSDLFFKSIYLKNKMAIFACSFGYVVNFGLFYLNYYIGTNIIFPISQTTTGFNNFDIYESLNDFIKIDDKRVIFIYTSNFINRPGSVYLRNLQIPYKDKFLFIVIIDIIQNLSQLISRIYTLTLDNIEPQKQIMAHAYNGFLLFSTTASFKDISYNDEPDNFFSLFMIFGYANGTDNIIDISHYLSDHKNYDPNDNKLSQLLFNNAQIENNIFRYKDLKTIKLVSIPQEIFILKQDNNINNNELSLLENNSYLLLGDIFFLEQNKNLIKSSKYYYIDYQHVIQEQDDVEYQDYFDEYRIGGGGARSIANRLLSVNINNPSYEPRIYYGRTNRLKFKLCHEYCDTCYEFGINNNEQKCSSCLPMYQYDYWYYNNNTQGNCVPEGYYNDLETNSLLQCNQINYKYYINITDNKTICFKDEIPCPNSYPSFNSTTKECFYCD